MQVDVESFVVHGMETITVRVDDEEVLSVLNDLAWGYESAEKLVDFIENITASLEPVEIRFFSGEEGRRVR